MKILDAGCYGVICPMVSNKQQAENFVESLLIRRMVIEVTDLLEDFCTEGVITLKKQMMKF